jgi:hypothetical protein
MKDTSSGEASLYEGFNERDLEEGSFTGEPFFFFEPEDIKSISLGVIWNFSGVTGFP